MANHGFMLESRVMAKDVSSLNVDAVATFDVDGGSFVKVSRIKGGKDDRYTATKVGADDDASDIAIAYNTLDISTADDRGNVYAGLTVDPRAFTNRANRTFAAFFPQLHDEIKWSVDAIDTTVKPAEDAFIVEDAGSLKPKVVATLAGTEKVAFKIISVDDIMGLFPAEKGKIGYSKTQVVHAIRVK